jgi:drug/metabolite transporter (DMT)-like permease
MVVWLMKPSRLLLLLCCGYIEVTKINAFQQGRLLGDNYFLSSISSTSSSKKIEWTRRGNIGDNNKATSQIRRIKTIIYFDRGKGQNEHLTSISATPSTEGVNDDGSQPQQKDTLIGTLVLLTVPISWGTYVPVVRYLYTIQPPVPGFVFSACYYTLAAVTTSILAEVFQKSPQISSMSTSELDEEESTMLSMDTSIKSSTPFYGGIELGLYLFVANCLQVVGLQTVQSDRAGFLVQLTTVMVPVCEGLFAGNLRYIPIRTWVGCIMAFFGLLVMGLDGKGDIITWDNPGELISTISQGDLLILSAAVLYTLHVVRLGNYARLTTPMKLAASKATTESILSCLLIVFLIGSSLLQDRYEVFGVIENDGFLTFLIETGREITSFFSSFTAGLNDGTLPKSILLPAFGSILWTGTSAIDVVLRETSSNCSPPSNTTGCFRHTVLIFFHRLDNLCIYYLGPKFWSTKSQVSRIGNTVYDDTD